MRYRSRQHLRDARRGDSDTCRDLVTWCTRQLEHYGANHPSRPRVEERPLHAHRFAHRIQNPRPKLVADDVLELVGPDRVEPLVIFGIECTLGKIDIHHEVVERSSTGDGVVETEKLEHTRHVEELRCGVAASQRSMTRPARIPGADHQTCFDRIAMLIRDEMSSLCPSYPPLLWSRRKDRPEASVPAVMERRESNVCTPKEATRRNQAREIGGVYVRRHQCEGQDFPVPSSVGMLHVFDESRAIDFVEQPVLPVYELRDEMVGLTRNPHAWLSCHASCIGLPNSQLRPFVGRPDSGSVPSPCEFQRLFVGDGSLIALRSASLRIRPR